MDNKFIELNNIECQCFLTLPGEAIILAKRQHPFIAIASVVGVILVGVITFLLSFYLLSYFKLNPSIILGIFILVLCYVASLKLVVDWYYHLYIVTNRKILNFQIKPFFSDQIDDVFLDQVRTTEIDTIIKSPLHELLDMGDVTIAFDRPSHEEIFALKNIKNPRETALYLGNELERGMSQSPVWFTPQKTNPLIKVTEDIYPQKRGAYS